eukprot:CAMPEP_0173414882 /NCGR_PEP_ID=MMETSP1356-20130122/84560_1 /TAXON_ID=77927 ORGANISM="Hemiselmis virescens, Strain PCC157" /NCGR_SAMPLE_ID=MMETSP1356 /ASSEMBLY_ACC=CAM_ASM_000847 /LENGTH=641 /DNA_ID=CAMNT_0014377089 /DNA_START=214 /DNA_END=2140 /DNA_ORIENTATION=+
MMGGGARSAAAGKVRSAAGAGMARPAAEEKNGLEKFLHNLHVLFLGILGGAPAAAETTERSEGHGLEEWLDGVDGLTDTGRAAILAILEEEEVASVEVLAEMWRDGDIQELHEFQALKKGARAALRKAILKLGFGENSPPVSSPASLGMASSPNAGAGFPAAWGNTLSPNPAASSPVGFGMASSPKAGGGLPGGFGMASSPMSGGGPPGGFGMASSPTAGGGSPGGFGMASASRSPMAEAASKAAWQKDERARMQAEMAQVASQAAAQKAERARMEAEKARMQALAEAKDMGLVVKGIEEKKGDMAQTPLCTAASNGDLGNVKLLLKANANIMAKNTNGWTSLYIAASKGHLEVVKHLGEMGGKELIMAKNTIGRTEASWGGGGEELIMTPSNGGRTALYVASQNGHMGVVKHLMEVGGRGLIMAKDKNGDTAEMIARKGNKTDIADYIEANPTGPPASLTPGGGGGLGGGLGGGRGGLGGGLNGGYGMSSPPKAGAGPPGGFGMASSPMAGGASGSPGAFGIASSPNAGGAPPGGFGRASAPMTGGGSPSGFGMASSPMTRGGSPGGGVGGGGGFGMASSPPKAGAGSPGGFGMASSPSKAGAGSPGGFGRASPPMARAGGGVGGGVGGGGGGGGSGYGF